MPQYTGTVLRINGTDIKKPNGGWSVKRYNVTNLARNAAAYMCGDLIAKKRTFTLTYEAIRATELDVILDLIWETASIFYTLTYEENNVLKTAEVYAGAIPSDLHYAGLGEEWVWKNVTFDLIER